MYSTSPRESSTNNKWMHSGCPTISVGSCSSWYPSGGSEGFAWVWENAECDGNGMRKEGPVRQVFRTSYQSSVPPRPFHHSTQNRTTVVLYGSSHIRELYFAFLRLQRGLSFQGHIEPHIRAFSSGDVVVVANPKMSCDPNGTGFHDGYYGVDLESCGLPHKRIIPEFGQQGVPNNSSHLAAIGFKTFFHTPDADQIFVKYLDNQGLRYPNVVITDVGVWGPRGNRMGGSANVEMEPEEELQYNLDWLIHTFPTSKIVVVVEPEVNLPFKETYGRLLEFGNTAAHENVLLLRKDLVMERRPIWMDCEHGCAGPVMVVVAQLILDWLNEATKDANKCF